MPTPTVTIESAVNAGIELRARWLRANHQVSTGFAPGESSLHTRGRMEGYVQALSLLLGIPATNVRASLHDAYEKGERGVRVAVDDQG